MNAGYRNVYQVIRRKILRYKNPKTPKERALKKVWGNIYKLYQEVKKEDLAKGLVCGRQHERTPTYQPPSVKRCILKRCGACNTASD